MPDTILYYIPINGFVKIIPTTVGLLLVYHITVDDAQTKESEFPSWVGDKLICVFA